MSSLTDLGLDELHGVAASTAVPRPERPALSAAPAASAAPAPNASPSGVREDSGLVRAFVIGSLVGSVVVFLLLGGMTLALGMGLAAALGVGAFTASWGGPGFGGMMGAVLHYSRHERA